MDREKQNWLKSIGAVEFIEPVKYTYGFNNYNGCFNLSEEYVNNTPLGKLKKDYEESRKYVKAMLSNGKQKDTFVPHDLANAEGWKDSPSFQAL